MKKSPIASINSLCFAAVFGILPAAYAIHPCPPDIDCNGAVNVSDLLSVINNWGQSSTPADVTGDGMVNVSDLLAVINGWGPCVFDFGPAYSNAEAQQIGLETLGESGPLTLPQATYDRIVQDLTVIRNDNPGLVGQVHSEAWVPNHLIVNVPNPLNSDYLCLNNFYQVTNVQPLFSTYYVLTFARSVNVPALALVYMNSGTVTSAEPDGLIGGENFWRVLSASPTDWHWDIDDGFLDCFDGCDCHKEYTITTTAQGTSTLDNYQQYGAPWCRF